MCFNTLFVHRRFITVLAVRKNIAAREKEEQFSLGATLFFFFSLPFIL